MPHALGHVWNKLSRHEIMQKILTALSKLGTGFRRFIVQLSEDNILSFRIYTSCHSKQLLPGLLVDSADYHPEKKLFPEGNAREK